MLGYTYSFYLHFSPNYNKSITMPPSPLNPDNLLFPSTWSFLHMLRDLRNDFPSALLRYRSLEAHLASRLNINLPDFGRDTDRNIVSGLANGERRARTFVYAFLIEFLIKHLGVREYNTEASRRIWISAGVEILKTQLRTEGQRWDDYDFIASILSPSWGILILFRNLIGMVWGGVNYLLGDIEEKYYTNKWLKRVITIFVWGVVVWVGIWVGLKVFSPSSATLKPCIYSSHDFHSRPKLAIHSEPNLAERRRLFIWHKNPNAVDVTAGLAAIHRCRMDAEVEAQSFQRFLSPDPHPSFESLDAFVDNFTIFHAYTEEAATQLRIFNTKTERLIEWYGFEMGAIIARIDFHVEDSLNTSNSLSTSTQSNFSLAIFSIHEFLTYYGILTPRDNNKLVKVETQRRTNEEDNKWLIQRHHQNHAQIQQELILAIKVAERVCNKYEDMEFYQFNNASIKAALRWSSRIQYTYLQSSWFKSTFNPTYINTRPTSPPSQYKAEIERWSIFNAEIKNLFVLKKAGREAIFEGWETLKELKEEEKILSSGLLEEKIDKMVREQKGLRETVIFQIEMTKHKGDNIKGMIKGLGRIVRRREKEGV
jgi:hypothetical protein